MKGKGSISAYSVNKKYISIKVDLAGSVSPEMVKELQEYKGRTKTFRFGSLHVTGRIASINLGVTTGFLIHARKYESTNRSLFNIMGKGMVDICVSDRTDDKILYFLEQAAKSTGKKRPDILYEVSSFKDVQGKKSVFSLSDEHKKVVPDKLSRLIKSAGPAIPGMAPDGQG